MRFPGNGAHHGVGYAFHHVRAPEYRHFTIRQGKHGIPGQQGGAQAEAGVRGRPAPPGVGLIQNIVMQQRCRVYHFRHGAKPVQLRVIPAQQTGRSQRQQRTQPFPPRKQHIRTYFPYRGWQKPDGLLQGMMNARTFFFKQTAQRQILLSHQGGSSPAPRGFFLT